MNSDQTIAETLPHLYREVLDGLARLEELGARTEAARWRMEAIAGYSRAWDAACQKRLRDLLARVESTGRDLERRRRPGLT